MQIKTTLRYHLPELPSPNQQTSAVEDAENGEPLSTVRGRQTGAAAVGASMGFPQKIETGTAFRPSSFTSQY